MARTSFHDHVWYRHEQNIQYSLELGLKGGENNQGNGRYSRRNRTRLEGGGGNNQGNGRYSKRNRTITHVRWDTPLQHFKWQAPQEANADQCPSWTMQSIRLHRFSAPIKPVYTGSKCRLPLQVVMLLHALIHELFYCTNLYMIDTYSYQWKIDPKVVMKTCCTML